MNELCVAKGRGWKAIVWFERYLVNCVPSWYNQWDDNLGCGFLAPTDLGRIERRAERGEEGRRGKGRVEEGRE